jgi:hypothetical protein
MAGWKVSLMFWRYDFVMRITLMACSDHIQFNHVPRWFMYFIIIKKKIVHDTGSAVSTNHS